MTFSEALSATLRWHSEYGNKYGETTIVQMQSGDFWNVGPNYPCDPNWLKIMRIGNVEDFLGPEADLKTWPDDDVQSLCDEWVREFGEDMIAAAKEVE